MQQQHRIVDTNSEGTRVHLDKSFVPFIEYEFCCLFIHFVLFVFTSFHVYKVIFGLQMLFSPVSFSKALPGSSGRGSLDLFHYRLRGRFYLHFFRLGRMYLCGFKYKWAVKGNINIKKIIQNKVIRGEAKPSEHELEKERHLQLPGVFKYSTHAQPGFLHLAPILSCPRPPQRDIA